MRVYHVYAVAPIHRSSCLPSVSNDQAHNLPIMIRFLSQRVDAQACTVSHLPSASSVQRLHTVP